MKIVVTGTRGIPNIPGGVETHCEQLYPRLVRLGCDVTVIRRSCYVNDHLNSYENVNLVDLYAPRKKAFEAIIHTFLACFKAKKLKADIIHIHAIGPALLTPLARMMGLRVVMTHHGPDYNRKKWGMLARFFLKQGERWGTKFSNEVIVISEEIRQLVLQKYAVKNIHLIPNGVTRPIPYPDTGYIEKSGLKSGGYILAAGRFVPEKGFDLLVKLSGLFREKGLKLVLAGDADHETAYSAELKKTARENGVILPGFITGNKLQEMFTHARLFVLPSYHEGLPISLLEAMSYNLDVLVSDIPANQEVGLSGSSYFKAGDIDSLQEKLSAKLEDNCPVKHIEYNMDRYDWNKIAGQVMDVYGLALSFNRQPDEK